MNKSVVILILVLLLGVGGYFGYKEYRRGQLLSSGEEVLLVNKKLGVYTTTELISEDEVTRSFKAVEKVSKLSDERYAKITEGLTLYGTRQLIPHAESSLQLPEGEALEQWVSLYQTLPPAVDQLCKQIDQADFAHECVARHLILKLLDEGQSDASCGALFPESLQEECRQTIARGDAGTMTDADSDGFIDMYEFYADPLSFEADPLS